MKRITVLILGMLGVAGLVSAQSLGELAKKNAAKKDTTKPVAKTYTNQDLGKESAPPPQPAATPAPAPAKATPAPDAAPDPQKTETYWKDRMRGVETQLANNQTALAAAHLQVIEVEGFIRPDGTMSGTIADRLLKARAEENRLIGVIANDKRAVSDLQEEARRANVPPGWLRWQ